MQPSAPRYAFLRLVTQKRVQIKALEYQAHLQTVHRLQICWVTPVFFSVHRNLKALQTSYKKVYKNGRHTREAPVEFLVKAGDHPKIKLTLVTQNCRELNEQLKFT